MNNHSPRSILSTVLGAAVIVSSLYGCTFSSHASHVTKQQAPIADSQTKFFGIDDPKELPQPKAPSVEQVKLQQQRTIQAFSRPRTSADSNRMTVVRSLHTSMKSNGYTDVQIAAMLGNIEQESKLNPFARSRDGAFGLMQWLGSRARQLKTFEMAFFAKNVHLDPRSFEGQTQAQVAFIVHEANGSHADQYAGLKRMTTLRGATLYFRRKVEVAHEAHARDNVRYQAAREHLSLIQSMT